MSRFVSATEASTQKDDAWSQAQQDIDESQKRQSEQKGQDEGKSLYDVLQANKGAVLQFILLARLCSDMSGFAPVNSCKTRSF